MATNPIKNLAIVANTSWYIYNFRKGFIKKAIAAGYNVHIIAPKDKFVDEIEALGATFIELKRMDNKGKNPFNDIFFTLELRKFFKSYKIGCALFFTPKVNIFGSIATKFSKTKGIATINGLGFVFNEGQPAPLRIMVENMYRFAFNKIAHIFFQNEEDRDLFIKLKIISKKKHVNVVRGSGVNLKEFYQRSDNNTSHITFLLSARLIKEKGIEEYLEAAKSLKPLYPFVTFALLGIVADNPSAMSLNTINELHQKGIIEFWGLSDSMSKTLDKVDVMVLPSYYREGVPKVLLEALAKGLPIITTDNVGCRETIEDNKNGYLIPIKNSDALINAIKKIIELSPERRKEMSIYSRNKAVKEFDEDENNNKYLSIINKTG